MKGNRKTKVVTTINGNVVNNAVVNKNGIPQLSNDMAFMTLSASGSVRVRGAISKTETIQ